MKRWTVPTSEWVDKWRKFEEWYLPDDDNEYYDEYAELECYEEDNNRHSVGYFIDFRFLYPYLDQENRNDIQEAINLLEEAYYNAREIPEGYSRGSKSDMRKYIWPTGENLYLPYKLVGFSDTAKHVISRMTEKCLDEPIIEKQLKQMGLKEPQDWKWTIDKAAFIDMLCYEAGELDDISYANECRFWEDQWDNFYAKYIDHD